jgi:hypothetical protein
MDSTTWIAIVAAGVAAAIAWYAWRARRRHDTRRELKAQVQTWEDEGGNVPDVPTVAPRVPPRGRP